MYNARMRWLILSVFLAASLSAQQVVTGTIAGTITDPDGHVVPRMLVQTINIKTGVVYRATSSVNGEYSIPELPVGTYELIIEIPAAGLRPFVKDDLQVTSGQTVKLDIQMEEGIALNTLGDGRDFFRARASSGLVPPSGAAPRMQNGNPDLSGYWSGGGSSDLGTPEFQRLGIVTV